MLCYCHSCSALNRVPLNKIKENKPVCGKCSKDIELQDFVQDVPTAAFDKILRNSKLPILVDFWASWCGPCQQYGPTFQMVSREFSDRVQFLKVNTESEQELAGRLGIRGIPNTVLIKDSKIIDSFSGALSYDQLRQWISSNL